MAENLGVAELKLSVDTKAFDAALQSARRSVENFSPNFRTLTKSLQVATQETKKLNEVTQTYKQVLNQVPASSFEKITAQIKNLSEASKTLKFDTQEYLEVLTKVKQLETLRDFRAGRAAVRAGANAFDGTGYLRDDGPLSKLPSLPNTIAADRQLVSELTTKLTNLDRTSGRYTETLNQLEAAQRRIRDALAGTSSVYRDLEQQEERSIRRAEKLAGIQSYYADKNPRAGGVRDESGALLARGAGSAADERAYQAALRPARELLETDLQRSRVLREISQRILQTAKATENGFGAASASNFGTTDPVAKSIRRNAEQRASALERVEQQRAALESDLLEVQARRVKTEKARANLSERLLAAEQRASGPFATPAVPGIGSRVGGFIRAGQSNAPGAVSSALIGGAFPALFGQGAGASVGGALGGALGIFGGGFGFAGSLIGTAIGQQADNLGTLSQALQDPIARFQELKDSALLSSRALEQSIEALINAGRYNEAEARIREDLAKKGLDAATSAQLASESEKLQRSLAELGVSIGLVVQGPLTDLINGFNKILEPGRVAAQSRAIQGGLSPEDLAAYQDRRRELNRSGLGIVESNKQANEEFASKTKEAQQAQEDLTEARLRDSSAIVAQAQSLAQLEATQVKLSVDSSEFIAATKEILETQDALDQLDGKRATITVEQIKAGIDDGSLTNNFNNLERRAKAAEQRLNSAEFNSPDYRDALSEAQAANFELARRREAGDPQARNKNFEEARQKVEQGLEKAKRDAESKAKKEQRDAERAAEKAQKDATKEVESSFKNLTAATDSLADAQKGLRSALEGSFDLLTSRQQDSLLKGAREDLDRAVRAGFFDSDKVGRLKDNQLIGAANQARAVLDADDALLRSQVDLVSANQALEKATTTLTKKDWNVNVAVNASSGDYAVNLG